MMLWKGTVFTSRIFFLHYLFIKIPRLLWSDLLMVATDTLSPESFVSPDRLVSLLSQIESHVKLSQSHASTVLLGIAAKK